MQFLAFHLMPFGEPEVLRALDRQADELRELGRPDQLSAWVTFSNSNYDPRKGHELYERYLDELTYASEIGFDGIGVNEHHQNAYGTMANPNLMAATLVQRAPRAGRIAILGNALPLHDPLRIAEDIAMLDVLSNGRIISGFVRGIGFEHYTYDLNPNDSRPRYQEAHDLVVAAWTRPGPFAWHGTYYHHEYVNPWPRPLQEPHPPIWIPTQGSSETAEFAAEHRYTFLQTYTPRPRLIEIFSGFRQACRSFGYEADPLQMGWAFPVHLAETDEKAREELRPHVHNFFNRLLTGPVNRWFPPGYSSPQSMQALMSLKGALFSHNEHTLEELEAIGLVLVGSPDTVLEKIRSAVDATGIGTLCAVPHLGTTPHDQVMKTTRLFAEEIIPALRDHVPEVLRDEERALAHANEKVPSS